MYASKVFQSICLSPSTTPRTRAVNMRDGMVEIKTRSTRWLDRNCPCQAGFEFFDYTGGESVGGGRNCEARPRTDRRSKAVTGFYMYPEHSAPSKARRCRHWF